MILLGNPLSLPAETGVKLLYTQQFCARGMTDDSGVVHRPQPAFVKMPFEHFEIGDLLFSNTTIASPPDFVLSVPGAVLAGERAIVTDFPHYLITDSAHPRHSANIFTEKQRRDFEAVHLDFVDGGFIYSEDAYPHIQVDDDVVLLSAMEQGNYGAFLLRVIPKLQLIKKLKLEHLKVIVSVDQKWQQNLLEIFGVSHDRIIPYERSKTYKIRNLIVPSMRTSELFLDDETRELFQRKALELETDANKVEQHEKLYVSRRSLSLKRPNYRAFVNEDRVIDEMKNLEFSIYEPEIHSLEDQIRTFAGANFIVGPGGAGMFNTIFSRPGSKVISMEPLPHWVGMHANIFSSMQHKYAFILGGADQDDPSVQKRWSTNVEVLLEVTRDMLNAG
jgi:capsular polysaccharide biosynthesis protein